MAEVEIHDEYIPLGSFLKLAGAIDTGGDAKLMIAGGDVDVNGEPETRRGRKLRPGDVVTTASGSWTVVTPQA
ncbi:RNA-binding S4 domain-containing protein [Kineosporia sp. J2-2]|uniref:RNA-binding S4 domain-containing protein n=1 Tax=Kineosporia corallincola TaxID=2835133 RepID=A0ABS5TIA4_9ACTN|nr:RNA-binding S4 domain-containing protein [Kineosporia corallincola]MBT0770810.1 RNA-binding S4 domain-containing protein [Kineosporia corallincola]